MTRQKLSLPGSIWLGALNGVRAWAIYWLAETLFAWALPRVTQKHAVFTIADANLGLQLLAFYVLAGFAVSGLLGAVLYAGSRRRASPETIVRALRDGATLTVVAAFTANLFLVIDLRLRSVVSFSLPALFALALLASACSRRFSQSLRFVTNPWTVCLTLVGKFWITGDLMAKSGAFPRLSVAAIFVAAVLAAAYLIQRLAQNRMPRQSTEDSVFPAVGIARLGFAAVCMLAFLGLYDRLPRALVPEPAVSGHPSGVNVILITMDTVRADHLSLYGYERNTTPNLAEFARNATVYRNLSAAADMTLPSHASIFTGLYSSWHEANRDPARGSHVSQPLRPGARTLAWLLAQNGYLTVGAAANFAYVSSAMGMDQGFQYFWQPKPVPLFGDRKRYYFRRCARDMLNKVESTALFDRCFLRASEIDSAVFPTLERLRRQPRPFFLFINYMDAHFPYLPPAPFDTRYPGKDSSFTEERYWDLYRHVLRGKREVTAGERNHLLSQYDGGIAYLDACLGRLLTRLKDLGLYENSLIIITSDHGETFGRRNLLEHAVDSVYQDQIHVPLIVKYPRSDTGSVVETPVSHVDILPTVLKTLGYAVPPGIQGLSLGESSGSRAVLSEAFPSLDQMDWSPRFRYNYRALIRGPLKLIFSSGGEGELYDLKQDPREEHDISDQTGEACRDLETRLIAMLQSRKSKRPFLTPDKKTIERLRSLGYVQ